MKSFASMFLSHPRAAGETYFQHMRFAFGFSATLLRAAGAAFVHGVVPGLCETTASSTVLEMAEGLKARRAALAHGKMRQAAASQAASAQFAD